MLSVNPCKSSSIHRLAVPAKNRFLTILTLVSSLFIAAGNASGQFVPVLIPSQDTDTGTIWFQTSQSPTRSAGIVELGGAFLQTSPPPSLAVYHGGSFSWTPTNVYLTLVGGTVSTTELLTPGGTPILNVQGIVSVASAFLALADVTLGTVVGPSLQGAAYIYTTDRVYLVLIGGAITVTEVTIPGGGALSGVSGIAVVGGAVQDNPATPALDAVSQGGVLIYTSSRLWLHLIGGGMASLEVLNSGSPIAGVRGITTVASTVPPPGTGPLSGGAYVWSETRVLLVTLGGALTVAEVLAPTGGSIGGTWGVVRLEGRMVGAVLQGAAQVVTGSSLFLTLVGGGITTLSIGVPSGAIKTNVSSANEQLRQARQLYGIGGQMGPGGRKNAGLILGNKQ